MTQIVVTDSSYQYELKANNGARITSEFIRVVRSKKCLKLAPTAVPTMIYVTDKASYKKMKIDIEKRIVSHRLLAKGFLQNRQIGRASKKDWDTDIPYF